MARCLPCAIDFGGVKKVVIPGNNIVFLWLAQSVLARRYSEACTTKCGTRQQQQADRAAIAAYKTKTPRADANAALGKQHVKNYIKVDST